MKVTTFNAIKNKNKRPTSPYSKPNHNSFMFTTHEVSTLKDCFDILTQDWVLSNPLELSEPIISERKENYLKQFRCINPGYTTLDIDDILTYDDMKKVINFFKKSDYNVVLGKSKNWDGETKFNLKGYIETTYDHTKLNTHKFLNILNEQIGKYVKIDSNAASDVSLQAPLFRNEILLTKLDSDTPIDNDFITINEKYIKTKKENEFIQNVDTSKMLNLCYDIYRQKGFSIVASRGQTLNWQHPNEVKSPGGYFCYVESPHIMHHHNKEKSINIFNEIRQTKEGKEFIKEQTAYELKKQFEEHKKLYNNELYINQQFIDITEPKLDKFLKKFLSVGDVLKVKSAMGTGKSKIIDFIIKEARDMDYKILLVSNRISVADDYANKYNIKTYRQEDDGWTPGEDLIVQMDSLYKYDLRDFDMVILDEFVSLMFQSINSMKDTMRPFNSAKLFHILKNKKIVMADAFLSGYEDCFYENKKIYYVQNNYRDNIDVSYYDKRDTFVSKMLKVLQSKKEDETVTASIMSNDVINAIYDLAEGQGYKVFKLTANTSEEAKKLIYKLFEDDVNDKWDLLLYSPTLTVGVSNMNNCTHHFHYDTGNAADVISSLQMVKRTRKMKHLHLFLQERVKLEPTDEGTLNDLFSQNLERYFKGVINTVTVEIDENSNFVLSSVGKFMNKIQAFQNRLENNHKLSFNILLGEQFKFKENNLISTKVKLNFKECIKKTKENLKKHKLELIDAHRDDDISDGDSYVNATRSLNDDEIVKLQMYKISQMIRTTDNNTIADIAKAEVSSDNNMIKKINNLILLYKKDLIYISNYIDTLISSGVKNSEFKEQHNFYRDLIKMFNIKLENWYSDKQIKELQERHKLNDFKNFLRSVGYERVHGRTVLNSDIQKYFKYFI